MLRFPVDTGHIKLLSVQCDLIVRIATIDADQLIESYLIGSKLKCNRRKKRLSNLKNAKRERGRIPRTTKCGVAKHVFK